MPHNLDQLLEEHLDKERVHGMIANSYPNQSAYIPVRNDEDMLSAFCLANSASLCSLQSKAMK